MKKWIALLLSLTMVLGMTACGGNTAEAPTEAPTTAPAAATDSTTADPHAEQVTLTIAYNKKGTDCIENNILDQILLEKFNIVVNWQDLEDSDYATNVTLQMAGNDYPDILWHANNSLAQELSLTGHILAVDDLEAKLPDWVKVFDEGVDGGWAYVKGMLCASDGKLYCLPSKNPRNTAMCWHLRAGTMQEMGLIDSVDDLPTTVEDFVALLEQIKEKDPDSIPFMVQGWGHVWDGWDYAYNVQSGYYLDYFSGEFVPYGPATDNWRQMLITLNYLYQNGLIAEDYLTTTEDMTKENTIAGMYYAEWNWAGSHTNAMNQRNSETDPNCGWIYYLNTIAADDSQHVYNKETPYPEMGPLAAKWFDHTGCDVWFLSRVTEVSREADVWKLTVSTIGGCFSITSNHLLDTTPDFDLHWFFGAPAPKGTLSLTVATEDGFDVLPVADRLSMAEARAAAWERYPRKILAFAPTLSFTPAEVPRSVWYPSNTVGSVADAIELGLHALCRLRDLRPGAAGKQESHSGADGNSEGSLSPL